MSYNTCPDVPADAAEPIAELLGRPELIAVARALHDAGAIAFLVGGSVFDLLDGRPVRDLDVACSLPVAQTTAALAGVGKVIPTGELYGTVTVLAPSADGVEPIEVTQFRAETYDPQSRNPLVTLVSDATEDFARRDFTVNAIGLRLGPLAGDEPRLFDPFGGVDDIANRVLRAVGDPVARFSEDPLRVFRFARIAGVKRLAGDEATAVAVAQVIDRLDVVSRERKTAELFKLLHGSTDGFVAGVELARRCGLVEDWFAGLPGAPVTLRLASGIARLASFCGDGTGVTKVLVEGLKFETAISRSVQATAVASAALEAGVGLADARQMVAALDDEVLDAAVELAAARGADVSLVTAARLDADRLRRGLPFDGNELLDAAAAEGLRLAGPAVGRALLASRDLFFADPDTVAEVLLDAALATAR